MAKATEQEVIRAVIETYRNMPFLWKKDNEDYLNKAAREEGYKVLLDIYHNWDGDCTMQALKKKIENLRSNYFKEKKKVIASHKAGGRVYVPNLWYFYLLTFLNKREANEDDDLPSQDPLDNDQNEQTSDNEETFVKIEPSTRKRKLERPITERRSHPLETARKYLPMRYEPWEITYGKSIGHQMKDLKGDQLVICQKLISDAIFFAKLNKLNECSQVVNPDIPDAEPHFLVHSYASDE
ncbi:uncharacterized protein LOC134672800 [Cydia fagiglandana]|uniref:uncharacterized protein LOC134672800 n=1 Tax=Cydia fagiglandana TaxID=1458189 RepID=UPI002FEE2B78